MFNISDMGTIAVSYTPPHFLYDGQNRYMHRYKTRRKKLIEQKISKIGPQTKKLRQISYLSQIL